VVVQLAINASPSELDEAAAGIELALGRATDGLRVVRVRPDDVPPDCGTKPGCSRRVAEGWRVDRLWYLVLARVGRDVRIEGIAWGPADDARAPIEPFIVARERLGDPTAYGATGADEDPAKPKPEALGSEPIVEGAPVGASPQRGLRAVPMGAWILGGTAAAAVATGIGFGLSALETSGRLEDDGCEARACDPTRVDELEIQATIADVAFVTAGISAVAAVILVLWKPRASTGASDSPGRGGLGSGPPIRGGVGAGRAWIGVEGRF